MILILLVHIGLAIGLFMLVNLIGQHAPSSFRYFELSLFQQKEEAPAFNFILRVITPVVYLILVSSLLYTLKADIFVVNIYWVNIIYILFRALFNILTNRTLLINWSKYIWHSFFIIMFSYLVYEYLIRVKANILPDFSNLANEVWLLIVVFLYQLLNNLTPPEDDKERRLQRYIQVRFCKLNQRYKAIILQELPHQRLQQLAMAIILYEDFNRPRVFRWLEYLLHTFSRKPHSMGVMQVRSHKKINDEESVRLGCIKLRTDYEALLPLFKADPDYADMPSYKDSLYQTKLIEKFNPDETYSSEIYNLAERINKDFIKLPNTDLFNH